jgi:hypothetical protein
MLTWNQSTVATQVPSFKETYSEYSSLDRHSTVETEGFVTVTNSSFQESFFSSSAITSNNGKIFRGTTVDRRTFESASIENLNGATGFSSSERRIGGTTTQDESSSSTTASTSSTLETADNIITDTFSGSTDFTSTTSANAATYLTYRLGATYIENTTTNISTTTTRTTTIRSLSASNPTLTLTVNGSTVTSKTITTFFAIYTSTIGAATFTTAATSTTTVGSTFSNGVPTTIKSTSVQANTLTAGAPFAFVTGIEAVGNEWVLVPIPSLSGQGPVTSLCETFTNSSTFSPARNFTLLVTTALPTVTTESIIGTVTITTSTSSVTDVTLTRPDITNTFFRSTTTFTTITRAIPSFISPYTQTAIASPVSVATSTESSTTTFGETIQQIISGTSVVYVSHTVTFDDTENASGLWHVPVSRTSTIGLTSDTTTLTVSLVHTGFSSGGFTNLDAENTTSTVNFFTTGDVTTMGTFAAGKTSETTIAFAASYRATNANNPGQKVYQVSYTDTGFLLPNANFSTQNPGSNISPIDANYIIPANTGRRDDGPFVPMPLPSSTILTFIRNSTGGAAATVNSTNYTTFRWSYSSHSLTVTTSSKQLDGTNTITVSSSKSFVLNLTPAGSVVTFVQPSTSFIDLVGNSQFVRIEIGGVQKYTNETVFLGDGLYNVTTYDNNNSGSFSTLITFPTSYNLAKSHDTLSVFEKVGYFQVCPGDRLVVNAFAGGVATVARNLTAG